MTRVATGQIADKKTVLVTRPQPQANEFIELLNEHALNALAFPCIDIRPIGVNSELKKQFKTLNNYDLIIFVSINAIEQTVNLLQQLNLTPASICINIATIGKASFDAAKRAGFNVSLSPHEGYNSDALLAVNALQAEQINGANCLIIRGEGGLEKLANTLQLRGASVSYAEVYRRDIPLIDKNISRQQLSENWNRFGINMITVTSNESLQNLYDMLEQPGKAAMLKTQLMVVSQRCVVLAKELGFSSVTCAKSALNQHMLEAIQNK